MVRALTLVMLSAFVLGACGKPETGRGVTLELGTGSYRFEPLEDGQELELVRGAQGGWHVWLSLRLQGMDAARPVIRLTMQPANESRPAHRVEVAPAFDPPDDQGTRELIGYTGIVRDPSCLVGELLRIEVSVPLDGGETVRAERDIVVRGGTYPPPPCP